MSSRMAPSKTAFLRVLDPIREGSIGTNEEGRPSTSIPRPQALAGEPYAYLKVPHSGVIAAPHGGPTLRAQVSTSAILRCSSLWILRSSIRSSSVPRPAERWSYVPFACLYSKTCASQAAYLWRSRHGSLRLIAAKTRLTILLRMMLRVTRSNPTEQAYEQHPSLMFTALL